MLEFVMKVKFTEGDDFSMSDAIDLLKARLVGLKDLEIETCSITVKKAQLKGDHK